MKIFRTVTVYLTLIVGSHMNGCGVSYPTPLELTPRAIAFFPAGFLVTANYPSNEITAFLVSNEGVMDAGTNYPLPTGSSAAIAIDFYQGLDNSFVATANDGSNDVTVFTISPDNSLSLGNGISYPLPTGSFSPRGIAFDAGGYNIATANESSSSGEGNVSLFNVNNGVLSGGTSYSLPSGSNAPLSVAFTPYGVGQCLATANAGSNDVTLFWYDLGLSNPISYPLPAGSVSPFSVAFSPDGTLLATANMGNPPSNLGDITLFTVTERTLNPGTSYPLPAGSGAPSSVAFSPSGPYLAVTTGGGVVVFQIITGNTLSDGILYATQPNAGLTVGAFGFYGSFFAVPTPYSVTMFNTASWCPTPTPSPASPFCGPWCIGGVAVGAIGLTTIASGIFAYTFRNRYCKSQEQTPLIN